VPLTDVTARRDRGAGRAAPSRAAGAPGYRGAVPRTAKRLKALGLPGWLAAANPVIIGLGRLGVVPGPVRVLTVPGRTTGEPRTTPVTPVVVAGRRYIIAAAPRADWARNARAVGHGELSEGRRRQAVTIREVHEPDLQQTVLRAFPVQAPRGVPFFVRLGLVEKADPDQFAATADRVAIFELQPSDDVGDAPAGDAPRG
jgi:deazaflavin-dependent oxidoreductase (nitroreductase family)